jgi:hypothetical protein
VVSYPYLLSLSCWRTARPYLTVCLEGLKHRFPLSLILPKVPEELFFV